MRHGGPPCKAPTIDGLITFGHVTESGRTICCLKDNCHFPTLLTSFEVVYLDCNEIKAYSAFELLR